MSIPAWLPQIAGMVQYEFLLQWRRRALIVLFLAALAIPVAGAFKARRDLSEVSGTWVQSGAFSPEAARQVTTANVMVLTWAPMFMVFLLVLPIAAADSIPRDRQLGVRELLDALPLSPATYLAGKLLSLWASLLAGLALALVLNGVLWTLLIGPFNWLPYLEMGGIGAGGLVVLHAGLALLIASGQSNRQWAILVGITLSLIGLTVLLTGLQTADPFLRSVNPSRPALFVYYLWGRLGATPPVSYPPVTFADVTATLGLGLAQLALAWLLAWVWMRRGLHPHRGPIGSPPHPSPQQGPAGRR